jgi:putative oxidoreductase
MNRLSHIFLLLGRLGFGVVLIAHGWQKIHEWTPAGTVAAFTKMGVFAPQFSTYFAIVTEFVGGIAILLGFLLPIFGVLAAINFLGAILTVHIKVGFIAQGGYEYTLILALFALVIAFHKSPFALDALLFRKAAFYHGAPKAVTA